MSGGRSEDLLIRPGDDCLWSRQEEVVVHLDHERQDEAQRDEVDAEVRVLAVRIGLGTSESTHRMVKPSRRRCDPRPQGSATVAAVADGSSP